MRQLLKDSALKSAFLVSRSCGRMIRRRGRWLTLHSKSSFMPRRKVNTGC